MTGSRKLIPFVLTILLQFMPGPLEAQRNPSLLPGQRIAPATATAGPLVVRSNGTAAPAGSERVEIAPSSLAAATKIALARGALGPGESVSSIVSTIRLTPAQPAVHEQAGLVTHFAKLVRSGIGGNYIHLAGSDGNGHIQSAVQVQVRSNSANAPVLVDYIINASEPVKIVIGTPIDSEQRSLAAGDHHVTVLMLPTTWGWHSTQLAMASTSPTAFVRVLAVELTTMK